MPPAAASIVELAELCDAVYGDRAVLHVPFSEPSAVPGGAPLAGSRSWQRVGSPWVTRAGFFASLYQNPEGRRVLAFRGTDDFWDTTVDDAVIAAGGVPPQALAALATASAVNLGLHDFITGHSLGGALAVITAVHLGRPAVTFNAPGVADSCAWAAPLVSKSLTGLLQAVARCATGPRVYNIRIAGDPVSNPLLTGFQPGRVGTLAPPSLACGLNALCSHSMKTCVQAVRADPANYRPVRL